MKKELICITCPNSCHLSVEERDGAITVCGTPAPRRGVCESGAYAPRANPDHHCEDSLADFPYLPVRTAGSYPERVFPQ